MVIDETLRYGLIISTCVTDTAHKTQLKAVTHKLKAAAYRTYSNHSGQSAQTRGWRRLTEAPLQDDENVVRTGIFPTR